MREVITFLQNDPGTYVQIVLFDKRKISKQRAARIIHDEHTDFINRFVLLPCTIRWVFPPIKYRGNLRPVIIRHGT